MSESRHWYVVRSKPRREEYAQGQLLRRGVETFLFCSADHKALFDKDPARWVDAGI